MVHFPGFARTRLWIHRAVQGFYPRGFPHSEIPGSMPTCGSPRLIAACHVLHRLLLPRHPPCALSSLTTKFTRHTAALFPSLHIVIPSGAPISRSEIDAQSRDLGFDFSQNHQAPCQFHGPNPAHRVKSAPSYRLLAFRKFLKPVRRSPKPPFTHQRALFQALIKIYIRLVVAQSIQLSNIVLVKPAASFQPLAVS
jgi:hypothetical protein